MINESEVANAERYAAGCADSHTRRVEAVNSDIQQNIQQKTYTAGSLADAAVTRYYSDQDMNCSESLLRAGNDCCKLGMEEKSLRTAAPFGGGMGIESVCGALTGSLMVLANLYVEQRAHESDRIKKVAADFLQGFEKQHGSIICKDLKALYHDDELGCREVVGRAAKFLEKFITDHNEGRVR